MRNAALIMGIIAGLGGMLVGFFGYGYIELTKEYDGVEEVFGMFDKPQLVSVMSVLAPILALAGGGMARIRALWGGVLMVLSSIGMYVAFGFNVFTMFPIALAGLGGFFALVAGKPDVPKAHF